MRTLCVHHPMLAFETLLPKWRFDHRQCQHGLSRDPKCVLLAKALEDLLHDRETGYDFVESTQVGDTQSRRTAEHFDPGRSINEVHAWLAAPAWQSRRAASWRDRLPTIRHLRGRESGRLGPAARTRSRPFRPFSSRCTERKGASPLPDARWESVGEPEGLRERARARGRPPRCRHRGKVEARAAQPDASNSRCASRTPDR